MTNLKATPSFLIELMNTGRSLDEAQANQLLERLNLQGSSVLTYENVRRAADGDLREPTQNIRPPVDPGPDTIPTGDPVETTKVSGPPSSMEGTPVSSGPLTLEDVPNYIQMLLTTDDSISIRSAEVIPILDILQDQIISGKEITIRNIRDILTYYSNGNEAEEEHQDIMRRLDRGEVIIRKEPESVFGDVPGQLDPNAPTDEELAGRFKELNDVEPPPFPKTRVLSGLNEMLTIHAMMSHH